MSPRGLNLTLVLMILTLAFPQTAKASRPSSSPRTPSSLPTSSAASLDLKRETIVLLHGLGLGAWAMWRMERALTRAGYRVINVSYPSRTTPLPTLADTWLPALLAKNETHTAERLHFVTHSMGGILLRAFLQEPGRRPENLGRVVMIAPPNHGSVVVDKIGDWMLFALQTGVNGKLLGTEPSAYVASLGDWNPAHPLGIIAGDRSLNPLFSSWHQGPNDGKVSVASSRLNGMRAHLVMPHSHTWLQYRSAVIARTRTFLQTGDF